MPRLRSPLSFALALILAVVPVGSEASPQSDWQERALRISLGTDSAGRAAAITERLDELGIAWRSEPFTEDGKHGHNLVADLTGAAGAPLLLIGAHYDRVPVGHGATDNASGVATVLALAAALHDRPLARHRVQVVFWDLEEEGLLGSRSWVGTAGREQPSLYVNFDVFGWGDLLWMMAPQPDEPLVGVLRQQAKAAGLGFSAGENYPPTDHLAFLQAGWPAVSFSLVGAGEVNAILAVFAGDKPDALPRVMQVIHSADDTIGQLESSEVPLALEVLEAGLRQWDMRQIAP